MQQNQKIDNISYSEILELLEMKKAYNVRDCAEVLEFKENKNGGLKLYRAWFCKSKLCPICNWRRAMKNSYQAQKVVEAVIKEKPSSEWLFLTLTSKNSVDGNSLEQSLKDLTKAFNKLIGYAKVKKNLIGFLRSTEVTVNKKDGSYNQHMHVLLCVKPKYFKEPGDYISQKDWVKFWKRALQVDYTPVVDIKKIKPNKKKDSDIVAAIKETSKYSVKSSDFLTGNKEKDKEVVSDLEQGLYKKRMLSYGGLLKEKHKELNLDDAEEGDLVRTSDEEKDKEEKDAHSIIAQWNFRKQNYYLRKS